MSTAVHCVNQSSRWTSRHANLSELIRKPDGLLIALIHLMKTLWISLLFSSVLLAGERTLTDPSVMGLAQAGISEAEILRLIATAPQVSFDLRPAATDAMLNAGVSEAVIRAMAARENGGAVSTVSPPTSGPNEPEARLAPASGSAARAVSINVAPVRKSTVSSLTQVRRLYIEQLPNDFDQYLRAEFFKQMPKRIIVVTDKGEADAIMTGVDEHDRRIASTITGRYLGLHDNTTASISVLDPSEKVVLWSNEAGDRSLMFPIMHRNGERKVASRIVSKLKKAMKG